MVTAMTIWLLEHRILIMKRMTPGAVFVHYGSKYGMDKIWDWRVISDIPRF